MNGSDLSKSDWLGVLGLIIGLIGLGSSYYFYRLSVKEREPVMLEESFRPLLVASDSIKNSPLRIVNADGKAIDKDLSSVRFYFWNKGSEPIKQSNILKPIQVELAADDIQIIDVKLITSTRPEITKPKIALSKSRPHSIDMNFDILEKDDGFSVEILYAGTHTAHLDLLGAIEGVQKVETNDDLAPYQFYKTFALKIGEAIFLVLAPVLFLFLIAGRAFLNASLKLKSISVGLGVACALVILFSTNRDKVLSDKIENVSRIGMLDIVPISIKLEPDLAARIKSQ